MQAALAGHVDSQKARLEYNVLYRELQPCVLIACNCSPGEPFLLLIRGIQQLVSCGYCHAQYQIESVSYDTTTVGADATVPGDVRVEIKRSMPPTSSQRSFRNAN